MVAGIQREILWGDSHKWEPKDFRGILQATKRQFRLGQ